MKRLLFSVFLLVFIAVGCGSYNARQVPLTEPKNESYCQRLGDMAVGLEPYMVKEKTNLVFDDNLKKEEIMALDVSMIADGDRTYVVKKSDIAAEDEFGNKYTPMTPSEVAGRIDKALRSDAGLQDDIESRNMPDEVTVSKDVNQHFLFYDMSANHAESRKFTVSIKADATDGTSQKAFRLTVDPMRGHMNPTERWNSYDERGVTPCGAVAKAEVKAAPAPAPAPAKEEAAEKAQKAAEKQERIFEKQQMK
jgi:hypothetical protein